MKTFFNNRRTGLVTRMHWGTFVRTGSRVLCSDGKIRALAYLAHTADTWFSVPAAIRVGGKYVTGYVTGASAVPQSKGFKVRRCASTFRPHIGQEDKHSLPEWPSEFSDELFNLLAIACDEEPNT